MDMVIDDCREQIVSRTDGMKIPGEMQVDIGHRNYLRITTACSTAFHAEAGSQAGFTQTDNGLLAGFVQSVTQSGRRRGLAFTSRGGGDRRCQDQFAIRSIAEITREVITDFRFVVTLRNKVLLGDSQFGSYFCYGQGPGHTGDFEIRQNLTH